MYGPDCATEKPAAGRLLNDEGQAGVDGQTGGEQQQQPTATSISATGNACWIKG